MDNFIISAIKCTNTFQKLNWMKYDNKIYVGSIKNNIEILKLLLKKYEY